MKQKFNVDPHFSHQVSGAEQVRGELGQRIGFVAMAPEVISTKTSFEPATHQNVTDRFEPVHGRQQSHQMPYPRVTRFTPNQRR